jgi:hypothetical protein
MPKYRMLTRGCSNGAVSGKHRTWDIGQVIEAPEGEFSNLKDSSYALVKPKRKKKAPAPTVVPDGTYETRPAVPTRQKRKRKTEE